MSTEKKINYNTNSQNSFVHNTEEVQIDINGATLKKLPLQSSELVVATCGIEVNADRFTGNGVITLGPAASRNTSGADAYYDMEGFDANGEGYVDFDSSDVGTQNQFCIRFKIVFPYTGTPSTFNYIVTSYDSTVAGGLGSLITLRHETNGSLFFALRNATNSATFNGNFGGFAPAAGQEYEFELNVDYSQFNNFHRLFIDGVQQGGTLGTSGMTANVRDGLRIGGYYTTSNSFKSSHKIRDVQLFNTVQHIADFPLEVPRLVNVYPLESLIEPQDISLAEGFINAVDDSDGGPIQYVLKIENQYKFILAGSLVNSLGTLATSSTLAEFVAAEAEITTAIESGARVTLVPILSSGTKGLLNQLVRSTTLTYDFYALPVSCNECTVYGFVKDNCNDIVSGTARIYVKKPIRTQGNVISFDETVDIRLPNGFFEIPVVIPETGTEYLVDLRWVDSDGKNWKVLKQKIQVPDATTALYNNIVQ